MSYPTHSDRMANQLERAKRDVRESAKSVTDGQKRIAQLTKDLEDEKIRQPDREKRHEDAKKEFESVMWIYCNTPWVSIQGKPEDPPQTVSKEIVA